MQTFDVAHFRQQGVDLIVISVSSSFGALSNDEQNRLHGLLQECASTAGLVGTVVPVWQTGGRLGFLAPHQWHSFFSSLTVEDVARNFNRKLLCDWA
jgi:hypothetical protein